MDGFQVFLLQGKYFDYLKAVNSLTEVVELFRGMGVKYPNNEKLVICGAIVLLLVYDLLLSNFIRPQNVENKSLSFKTFKTTLKQVCIFKKS